MDFKRLEKVKMILDLLRASSFLNRLLETSVFETENYFLSTTFRFIISKVSTGYHSDTIVIP